MALLKHASAVLDPFPVSSAVNTISAFAVGTPVITLPSSQRFGFRFAAALWHRLLEGCEDEEGRAGENVPEGDALVKAANGWYVEAPVVLDVYDYVEAAVDLATDPQRRQVSTTRIALPTSHHSHLDTGTQVLKERISSCRGALFEDTTYADDLARFLTSVANV